MPASSEGTRRLLVDAATREFAEKGVRSASLLEVTRRAGQRNRASVHYHFGSREGILVAVLTQHHEFLRRRNAELLEEALALPEDDLVPAVRALAVPAAELGEGDWRGRCYLMILAELTREDVDHQEPAVVEAMSSSGGYECFLLLRRRLAHVMPGLCEALREERLHLAMGFLMRSVADRGRAQEQSRPARPQLPIDHFTENLVAMAVAMLLADAPTPPAG